MARDFAGQSSGDWDRRGLPAWAYHEERMFEIEKERLFRTHWQIVGHVNDMPEPGDYITLDLIGDRAIVIRGHDGVVRAFHNICRHRGTRVVAEKQGRCNKAIICPFHGWAYNLDGTLRGVAERQSFPPLDKAQWGLTPIELEIWHGFIFVKFAPSDVPSVAEQLAPYSEEVARYPLETMVPEPSGDWSDTLDANWKSLREIDSEGYHVRQAHPALHDLYGDSYVDEGWIGGACRSEGIFNEAPGRLWSVRNYRKVVDAAPVGAEEKRRWVYIGLFPNTVIGLYPDSVNWYRELPLSAGRTRQEGRMYRFADESRELRIARYLAGRIDKLTAEEDHNLCIWAYEATKSPGFEGVILSDLEHGLKSFHDRLRACIPELSGENAPA